MIKIYRVEGIDETNTPLFDDFEEQYDYFDSKVIYEYTSYFPPLFSKNIDVTTDTNLIISGANYLSLDIELGVNNEPNRYFYFVTNIQYISETVYRLELSLDTIQTFMFKVKYNSGIVNRMLINRWNGNQINREYIRENYSNDVMKITTYTDYTKSKKSIDSGWVVAKVPSEFNIAQNTPPTNVYTHIEQEPAINDSAFYRNYTDGTRLILVPAGIFAGNTNYVAPLRKNYIFRAFLGDNLVGSMNYNQLIETIKLVSEIPELVDLYYLNENCIDSVEITETSGIDENNNPVIYIDYSFGGFGIDATLTSGGWYLYGQNLNIKRQSKPLTGLANINTYTEVPFSSTTIPQLLDENYQRIYYGERLGVTSFPLHLLETPVLYLNNYTDIFSGYRNYWINAGNDLETFDRYRTLKVLNTKELMPIWKDALKTYISSHIGSLTISRAYTTMKSIFDFTRAKDKDKGDVLSKFADNNVQNLSQDINALFTPDVQSQGNEFTNDAITGSLNKIMYVEKCTNLEDVARIYETNGYKVLKVINSSPYDNLTRYYYNYFEISNLSITGEVAIPFSLLDDIKRRWQQGIRLYSIKNMPSNMRLGDVCIYDNVELNALQ